jgi:2,3-bisphosphoglycerate-dependent phosphoglycerate mutase
MLRSSYWALSLFCFVGMTAPSFAQRAIILVRHAEKEAGAGDVSLSEAGKKRADRLMNDMKDAGIDVVYTTKWKRTIETAKPLAESLKIPSKIFDANKSAADFAKQLQRDHDKQCVLIVSHSNRIPDLIDALVRRKTGIKIADDEFDHVYILLSKPDGVWAIIRTRSVVNQREIQK